MSDERGNIYVNFLLYAVLGKMAEADDLMRRFAPDIAYVARALAHHYPPPVAPIYRGMLIDERVRARPIDVCALRTFISWSEDADVAYWFACHDTVISEPLAMLNPRLRGVVLTLARPRRVLFHHTWAEKIAPLHEWPKLARLHPHMGVEGGRQIEWSLRTQREVITTPLDALPSPVKVEDVCTRSAAELDAKLCPPWIS